MWKRGEKAELAFRAGISKSHLSNMLARRSRANPGLAVRLAEVCVDMRLPIPKEAWVFTKETENEFFAPKEG